MEDYDTILLGFRLVGGLPMPIAPSWKHMSVQTDIPLPGGGRRAEPQNIVLPDRDRRRPPFIIQAPVPDNVRSWLQKNNIAQG